MVYRCLAHHFRLILQSYKYYNQYFYNHTSITINISFQKNRNIHKTVEKPVKNEVICYLSSNKESMWTLLLIMSFQCTFTSPQFGSEMNFSQSIQNKVIQNKVAGCGHAHRRMDWWGHGGSRFPKKIKMNVFGQRLDANREKVNHTSFVCT